MDRRKRRKSPIVIIVHPCRRYLQITKRTAQHGMEVMQMMGLFDSVADYHRRDGDYPFAGECKVGKAVLVQEETQRLIVI